MATTTEPTALKREAEEEDASKPSAEDEDTGAQVAPIVKLQEVAVSTGEENEDVLLDLKAKLYRLDKEKQWKERGVGTVKLLKDKESGKIRLVMRQNKTLKICANHLVLSTIKMKVHNGNEKSCVWYAADFADEELKEETFCIRFPSIENCKTFIDKIKESIKENNGESEEATAAAGLIEKLSVKGNDKEEKPESKDDAPLSSGDKKEDDNEKLEKPDSKE